MKPAENGIGIFAVSTFNTDYVLVKADNFEKAALALEASGVRCRVVRSFSRQAVPHVSKLLGS
jgi:hypothetical protein